MQSVTTNGKCRKVSPGCSKSRISEHSARSVSYLRRTGQIPSRIQLPEQPDSESAVPCAISCKGHEQSESELLEFAHQYLKEWDMAKPGNRCWSIHTMTRTTPTCISSPRELRRTERRLPMIMSAGVRRKSLTVSLERTGNRNRKGHK